jgi:hypothetical protein
MVSAEISSEVPSGADSGALPSTGIPTLAPHWLQNLSLALISPWQASQRICVVPEFQTLLLESRRVNGAYLDRVDRGSVEETLNAVLHAEADRLCNAKRHR